MVESQIGNGLKKTPNTFPLLYIGVLAFIVYALVLVGRAVLEGVAQTSDIQQKLAEVEKIKLQIAIEERFLIYQKTPSYIDRQARQHFGYARPGETTVILPENSDKSQTIADEQAATVAQANQKVTIPNPELWWQYLMGR